MYASLFKCAGVREQSDPFSQLPQFNWKDLSAFSLHIGNGSFGSEDSAVYWPKCEISKKVVLSCSASGQKQEFVKEAILLHRVKGNPTILLIICVVMLIRFMNSKGLSMSKRLFNGHCELACVFS